MRVNDKGIGGPLRARREQGAAGPHRPGGYRLATTAAKHCPCHVPAVELADWKKIQPGDEQAKPSGKGERTEPPPANCQSRSSQGARRGATSRQRCRRRNLEP